jgi:hypothetical protein
MTGPRSQPGNKPRKIRVRYKADFSEKKNFDQWRWRGSAAILDFAQKTGGCGFREIRAGALWACSNTRQARVFGPAEHGGTGLPWLDCFFWTPYVC